MPTLTEMLDEAIVSVERLRKSLSKSEVRQVSARDEQSIIKATALAWLSRTRPAFKALTGDGLLQSIDGTYQTLLQSSEKNTVRSRYLGELKTLKEELVKFRSQVLSLTISGKLLGVENPPPPDFAHLIPDPAMQTVLNRRWNEAWNCLSVGAYLAATVMMGAILEALLLARVNKLANKAPVFTASAAPRDKAGKTKPLQDWTLNSYIDVAHELGWIGKPSRDIGVVLRDYRNFIHPEKELTQGITLGDSDCRMFGSVLQVLADEIIRS